MSDDCHIENRNADAIISTLKRKGMHLQAEAFKIALSELTKQRQLAQQSATANTALRSRLEQAEKELSKEWRLRRDAQNDADMWKFSIAAGDHQPLLVKVWNQRKEAERRAEAAEKALADARNAALEESEMQDDIDAHEKPRYTTRRMHYEIDNAEKRGRNEAFEEAARVADQYKQREPGNDGDGFWASAEIAAAIRAKVTP